MTATPGYWMHETSGVLRPVVEAYLHGDDLSPEQVAVMRAYLRQWIAAPQWVGDDVERLRRTVGTLSTRAEISRWLDLALDSAIDPL